MLAEIFKAFLITSLAGSFLAAAITLLKPVTKKVFGYSWHYYIWLAVLFVMLAPVRFTLPQSNTDIPVLHTQTPQTDQITEAAQMNIADAGQNMNTANTITTVQKATDFINMIIENRMNYLGIIWLLGTVFCLLININGYIRLIMRIHKNSVVISCPEASNYTDRKITVRLGKDLFSPFMLGVFRPTLVLPDKELSAEQLNNILRHEMTHFKRKDILYKWFTLIVRSVHWFNPIVYYVARQINNECEISCDLSVTSGMNGEEQISYINTILSLVSGDRVKRVPLTTQMASGKKILKRRFTMIKNVKKTSKLVSVLSAVIAVAMLGTTVFASGVLSYRATDNYTVEITNNGEIIELANKPFVENGEVYLPLREAFEKVGVMDNEYSYINWDNGVIDICLSQRSEGYTTHQSPAERSEPEVLYMLYNYAIEIGKAELTENSEPNLAGQDISRAKAMDNAPILKNGVTYIPYSYVDYMLNLHKDNNINYSVYDKDGNLIYLDSFYHQVLGEYSIKIPDSWSGKYAVNSSDNIISFVHKATYEKYGGGTLFCIEKVNADSAEEILNMLGGSRLLYSNDDYAYIFEVPTDVQYPIWIDRDEEDIAIAAEYEEMFADIDFISNSFALADA